MSKKEMVRREKDMAVERGREMVGLQEGRRVQEGRSNRERRRW